jgi:catechol 2,3-dioxygenase-like lactoylglutathione lyase family enzyme
MEARLNLLVVMVSDMDRSVAFYRDTLGLRAREVSEWWSAFDAGGVTLALHPGETADAPGRENGTDAGTVHISFAVQDIDRACAELRAGGVAVDGPRVLEGMDIAIATFGDPDGISLQVEQA